MTGRKHGNPRKHGDDHGDVRTDGVSSVLSPENTELQRVRTTGSEAVFVARDLSPAALLESLRALFPARVHPTARRRFTLLDTFDHRVSGARARLVSTGTNGSTTLAWQPSGGRTRHELHAPAPVHFAWDLPTGPLRQALEPVIGVRRLFPQAEIDGQASSLEMLDRRGKVVARVSVESMQARAPGARNGWRSVPTVVTVSSLRGYEHAYARVLAVMKTRPGMEAAAGGMTAAVGDTLGIGPGLDASTLSRDLSPTLAAGDAARRIHRALIAVIEANEEGVRADLDTEFLHDYRVALRRIRSLLGQIRHVIPADVLEHFQSEFSWLGRLTGPARDLDVITLALREPVEDLVAEDQRAVAEVLERARQRTRTALLDALGSERRHRLLADWKAFLDAPVRPGSALEEAQKPFVDVASRRAWRLYARIATRATALSGASPAAEFHQLRIDAKKLRYVVDVIPGMEAPQRASILSSLKKLQRVLGDYNDAEVQERTLVQCAEAAEVTPSGLLAIGRLAERNRFRARALRGPVMDQLASFCAADTRAIFKRALKRDRTNEGQPCA